MAVESSVRPKAGWGAALVAVLAPVAFVALSFALWWISDQLLYVGPLDRAQFGWLVVMPLLLLAPVVAGFAAAKLREREGIAALVLAGAVAGLGLAVVFWRAVEDPHCPTGNAYSPSDWIAPSLIVGGAFAASLAVSGLATRSFVREHRRVLAVIVGIGLDVLLLAMVLVVAGLFLARPGCERPGTIG